MKGYIEATMSEERREKVADVSKILQNNRKHYDRALVDSCYCGLAYDDSVIRTRDYICLEF